MSAAAATTETTDREAEPPAVVGGVLKRLSVSQLRAFGQCPRKWWFRKVGGREEPEGDAARLGKALHGKLEHYLLTREDVLPPALQAGKHLLPPPGTPFLEVERGLKGLESRGVPFAGRKDCVSTTKTYLDGEGRGRVEACRSVEVLDWKTTKDLKWALTAEQLVADVQMLGYAEDERRARPELEAVRVSHVYFRTRGSPQARKVTASIPVDTVAAAWQRVGETVRAMEVAASAEHPGDVEARRDHCSAYGGCPHLEVCPVTDDEALALWAGPATGGHATMSVLDDIWNDAAPVRAIVAELPPAPPPAPPKAPPAAAPPAPPAPAAAKPAPVAGDLMARFVGGQVVQAIVPSTPPAAAPSRVAGILPPDAPRSEPPRNAEPIPPEVLPSMPPEVQAVAGQWAPPAEEVAASQATGAATAKKRGARKPAEARAASATEHGIMPDPGAAVTSEVHHVVAGGTLTGGGPLFDVPGIVPGIVLFVDVLTLDGFPGVRSLEGYIAEKCAEMLRRFGRGPDGAPAADLRCAPDGSPLAFGKWRGVVHAVVRAEPPPAGLWSLSDVRESEVKQEFVNALRPLCAAFARGSR